MSGPFRAHQVRDGDHYELSGGYAIRCMAAGERHARAVLAGGRVLATDPAVGGAVGVDAGFTFQDGQNLRAPNISVGVGDSPGWMRSAPSLAVEYSSGGQDEAELQAKIGELLAAGTRLLWVVRRTAAATATRVSRRWPAVTLADPGRDRDVRRGRAGLKNNHFARTSAVTCCFGSKTRRASAHTCAAVTAATRSG